VTEPADLPEPLQRYLRHLEVERRLAERTRDNYTFALRRLAASAAAQGVALPAAQSHHVRTWAAQAHRDGLAPRSLALMLAAWRGLYRWWGEQGVVTSNPVVGVRAPKAAQAAAQGAVRGPRRGAGRAGRARAR
jgi:integrase/recombinase XerC